MMKRLGSWKNRLIVIISLIILYLFLYLIHIHNNNIWLPEIIHDETLKKKTVDGPLIIRDDIFNNNDNQHNKNVLKSAVLIDNPEQFFDQSIKNKNDIIKEVKTSPPKPLNITTKFLKKFKNIAKKTFKNTNDFILFTVINEGYYNLTSNFLCNLYAIDGEKLHKKIFIVSLQKETCEKLKSEWPKIQCLSMESDDIHNKDVEWGNKIYIQILIFRAKLLYELTKLKISFILFETDSIWFKNPFEMIANMTIVDDADIIIPLNGYSGKQIYAFDPLIAFNTSTTEALFKEMNSRLEKDVELMDQQVLNELCSSQFNGVVCRNFEWSDVADGKWFKLPDRQKRAYHPYIVNNNYYVGVRNKAARQAINGLWFLSPKGHCNMSKAKKLLAKYRN